MECVDPKKAIIERLHIASILVLWVQMFQDELRLRTQAETIPSSPGRHVVNGDDVQVLVDVVVVVVVMIDQS